MPRLRRSGMADLPVGPDAQQRVPTIRILNSAGATMGRPPGEQEENQYFRLPFKRQIILCLVSPGWRKMADEM